MCHPLPAPETRELLRRHNTRALTAFIIGMEAETEEDIERTIAYARTLDAHQAQFSILTPYPGTLDWDRNKARIFDDDWANFTGSRVVFHRDSVTADVLESKLRKGYITFYNPLRRLDRILVGADGLHPKELFQIWRTLRGRDAPHNMDDPVSATTPLAPASRDAWMSGKRECAE